MSRLGVGIIGAGGRGIMSFGCVFRDGYADQTQLVALADTNRTRAERAVELLGRPLAIHESAADLVARKDVDAVVITSPDWLHEEHALLALGHGKHVLVDKPLAVTAAGCLRVIESARRMGRVAYMGFNLRHDPVVRRLKELVSEGAVGRPFSVQAIEHYDGGRTYMARWNRLKRFSGGLFIHKGSHDFDIVNWLLAPARPVRVSCFANVSVFTPDHLPFAVKPGVAVGPTCTACPYAAQCPDAYPIARVYGTEELGRQYARMWDDDSAARDGYHKDVCLYLSDKDTHDQGIAIVEYDTGATASHSEYFATPITNRRYLVEGDRGHGEADLHANHVVVQPRWSGDRIVHELRRGAGGHGGADPAMCGEFLRCIREGAQPSASVADGAWSVAIGQAAELARAEKRVVAIRELLDIGSDVLRP